MVINMTQRSIRLLPSMKPALDSILATQGLKKGTDYRVRSNIKIAKYDFTEESNKAFNELVEILTPEFIYGLERMLIEERKKAENNAYNRIKQEQQATAEYLASELADQKLMIETYSAELAALRNEGIERIEAYNALNERIKVAESKSNDCATYEKFVDAIRTLTSTWAGRRGQAIKNIYKELGIKY